MRTSENPDWKLSEKGCGRRSEREFSQYTEDEPAARAPSWVVRCRAATLACMRRTYLTDLSEAEWTCLEAYLPSPGANGRRVHSPREVLNAIFYVVRSGCAWRLLPHDFLP